jgi:hypothetical protein
MRNYIFRINITVQFLARPVWLESQEISVKTANKESVHYIHSYSVKHSDKMVITLSIMKYPLHFWHGLFILIPQSKYQKTSNLLKWESSFTAKPSLFPTEQYKPM